jgi:hypothetical protein
MHVPSYFVPYITSHHIQTSRAGSGSGSGIFGGAGWAGVSINLTYTTSLHTRE